MSSFVGVWTDLEGTPCDEVRQIAPGKLIQHICASEIGDHSRIETKLEDFYAPLAPQAIGVGTGVATRVVQLNEPLPNSSIPSCSLREVQLSKFARLSNPFTAVSYTWIADEYSWYGVELPQLTTIIINGHLVAIPSRIALILGILFEMGVKQVWIDYLSINQLDVVERGEQVAKMHWIFETAAQTVIFLGKPTEDTDFLFHFTRAAKYMDFIHRPECQPGLQQLFRHRYWHRAWVLQEIAASRHLRIICGNFILGSSTSHRLLSEIQRPNAFSTDVHGAELDLKSWNWRLVISSLVIGSSGSHIFSQRYSMYDIAWRTKEAECSEPRDALFSKLYLAVDTAWAGRPDYTESVGSLFTRFATHYLKQPRALDSLASASGYLNRLEMPTWAVDWTPRARMPSTCLRTGFESLFVEWPLGDLKPQPGLQVSFSNDGKELIVLGRVVKKMSRFHQCSAVETSDGGNGCGQSDAYDAEKSMVDHEAFLCFIYGCSTLLVLLWKDDHYLICNTSESNAMRMWAEKELAEAASQAQPNTYNFSELRIR